MNTKKETGTTQDETQTEAPTAPADSDETELPPTDWEVEGYNWAGPL